MLVIIDTGCANFASVVSAIKRLDYPVMTSADPQIIKSADKLLLPGVGTAKAAMQQLRKLDLIDMICQAQQPTLGICLGMQIMARSSGEGNVTTLGLIDQAVEHLVTSQLPLPHMGWNKIRICNQDNPLFHGIEDGSYFYFVHSYRMPVCKETIAESQYGEKFSSVVQKNNFYGVQFHPEKSGTVGAKLLKNFLEL